LEDYPVKQKLVAVLFVVLFVIASAAPAIAKRSYLPDPHPAPLPFPFTTP
jgi:hypothetical protein